MSGADHSNEAVTTGRWNRAEDFTTLFAQVLPGGTYIGHSVLEVGVSPNAPDEDGYGPADQRAWVPQQVLTGLRASGSSGRDASGRGGTGVHGIGGTNAGTGVIGDGGSPDEGDTGKAGGIGVVGRGGSFNDRHRITPGAGVVGTGGRAVDGQHAPGVVGVGGLGSRWNNDTQVPDSTGVSSGAGVYGRGALDNWPPAPGMIGRGGGSVDPENKRRGPGVVGLSDGAERLPMDMTLNAGVVGVSDISRGGIFFSDQAAQVQLIPGISRERFGVGAMAQPTLLATERGIHLPKDGRAGDLFALSDGDRCGLWFCTANEGSGPARWAQVLLGPEFDGTS